MRVAMRPRKFFLLSDVSEKVLARAEGVCDGGFCGATMCTVLLDCELGCEVGWYE